MIIRTPYDTIALPETTASERQRVLRLCTSLTGDPDIAEDLAQETMLVAWRQQLALRDPKKRTQWLLGIARNISMNWLRKHGREQAHLVISRYENDDAVSMLDDLAGDELEPDIELERHELAEILDRALALLPSDTRDVLIESYIRESPQQEIARRLGVSPNVIKVRLHRGKIALRRVMEEQLSAESLAYGLISTKEPGWQHTRIWCPTCGQATWQVRFAPDPDRVNFRCPVCTPESDTFLSEYRTANPSFAGIIGGLVQPRAIRNRTAAWAYTYFRQTLKDRAAICTNCGRPARLSVSIHNDLEQLTTDPYVLLITCEHCGEGANSSFVGLITNLPEAQAFWNTHGWVRKLPEQEIEVAGRPALVTRLESVKDSAHLDIVSARDNLDVLDVHGGLD